MTKRCLAAVLAVVLGLGLTAVTAAELDLGVRGGYQKISDADNGGFLGGAFLRMDWHRVIFVEGAVMYNTQEQDIPGGTVDVEFIPIQLSLQIFVLRRDDMFCPYIMAGGGAYVVRTTDNVAQNTESEYDFGWHLGLGLDVALSEKFFIEADLRYIWLDVDTEGQTVADTLSNFNTWQACVGFGFRI